MGGVGVLLCTMGSRMRCFSDWLPSDISWVEAKDGIRFQANGENLGTRGTYGGQRFWGKDGNRRRRDMETNGNTYRRQKEVAQKGERHLRLFVKEEGGGT